MLRVVFALVAAAAMTAVLIPVQAVALKLKLPMRRSLPVLYHRGLCALIGVRVRVIGAPMQGHPLLIVANHSSWLDIPIITSATYAAFVAKSEIASWPLIGLLAKLQGCMFVERTRRHKTGEINAEIARRLADGDPVLLFGEGTAGDGNRVLPFRSALIGAARDAVEAVEPGRQVFIQPLSVAYTTFYGIPMGRQHRPLTSWCGKVPIAPHAMRILKHGALDVVMTWGEPMAYDPGADRKAVAKSLHATVRRLNTAALRGEPMGANAAERVTMYPSAGNT